MERISVTLSEYQENGSQQDHEPLLRDQSLKPNISTTDDLIIIESVDFKISYDSNFHLYQKKELHFKNCTFTNDGSEMLLRIDSSYHKSLKLETCQFQNVHLSQQNKVAIFDSDFNSLTLDGCKQVSTKELKCQRLSITHCPHVDSLMPQLGTDCSLTIYDSTFFGSLNISNASFKECKIDEISFKKGYFTFVRNQMFSKSHFTEMTGGIKCSIQDNVGEPLILTSTGFDELNIYQNKCSLSIENSEFLTGKVNLNKVENLSFNNVSVQDKLVFDKNQVGQIDLEQLDISNVSFAGNEGDLSVTNATGNELPNLTGNSFNNITLSDIKQEDEQWNINFESCNQLSLTSIYVDTLSVSANHIGEFNIETSMGDLDLKANKLRKFKLSHYKTQRGFQIQIKESDSIELSQLISPTLNTKLETNSTFSIESSETALSLSAGHCNEFSAKEVSKGQDCTIEIDKSDQIKIDSFRGNRLKIVCRELSNIEIIKSHTLLDLGVIKVKDLLIENHKQGLESRLETRWVDSIRVISSHFSKLTLSANHSESIDLNGITSNKLFLLKSNSNKIVLHDINSNNLTLADVKADELNLTTREKERNQKLNRCQFLDSTLISCSIQNYEFTDLHLERFTSEKLEVFDTFYKGIRIKGCSQSWIGMGSPIEVNRDQPYWLFRNFPSVQTAVVECQQIDKLVLAGAEQHGDVDPGESPSVLFRETSFGSVQIFQLNMDLIFSEDSQFTLLEIDQTKSYNSPLKTILQGGQVESLTIKDTRDQLNISSTRIGKALITESTLSSLTIGHCKVEDMDYGIDNLVLSHSQIQSIDISDSDISRLSFSDLKPTSLMLKGLKLQNLSLHDFEQLKRNEGKFELRSINKGLGIKAETFEISESNLSGLSFNSCYFSTFKELSVKESKLDEIKCTATTWPTSVTSTEGDDKQFEIREACRQLKFAMASHHDKVSELQFHALEMGAYRQIIRQRGWKSGNFNDRLSLWAGNSNKFGMNWGRPLGWIILSVFIHYLFILISHHPFEPRIDHFWTAFNWGDFFLLFNPTHRFSNLSIGETNWGWTVFWDFSSKIWSAFFIYQIVAAFRKFRRS